MDLATTTRYVAECFWADVGEDDLRAVDERASAAALELVRAGSDVRYLGSMLIRQDDVVLCLFEGSADAVRVAAERAGIPFERLLEASASSLLRTTCAHANAPSRTGGFR